MKDRLLLLILSRQWKAKPDSAAELLAFCIKTCFLFCHVLEAGVSSRGSGEAILCPVCGKIISGRNKRQNLQYHMITHTGHKPFQCPYCPHRANRSDNMKIHIRSRHLRQTSSTKSLTSEPSQPNPTQVVEANSLESQIQDQATLSVLKSFDAVDHDLGDF
ncbi:zinc finger protein 536-like [Penaeus indicus]|uniref:zinc finger protein 536-like n=1 Tax=Penaeus indicus TaxID=29960 RepID=UPI00300D8FC7